MKTKNFDGWNEVKKETNKDKKSLFPRVREIWFLKLWVNIWNEQDWKDNFLRPILIVKKIWSLYFWIPITKAEKVNNFYYKISTINFFKKYQKKNSCLVLSQGRTFSLNRFVKKVWKVDIEEFLEIKKKLKDVYL